MKFWIESEVNRRLAIQRGQLEDFHNEIRLSNESESMFLSTEHLVFDRKISKKRRRPAFGVLVLRSRLLLPRYWLCCEKDFYEPDPCSCLFLSILSFLTVCFISSLYLFSLLWVDVRFQAGKWFSKIIPFMFHVRNSWSHEDLDTMYKA